MEILCAHYDVKCNEILGKKEKAIQNYRDIMDEIIALNKSLSDYIIEHKLYISLDDWLRLATENGHYDFEGIKVVFEDKTVENISADTKFHLIKDGESWRVDLSDFAFVGSIDIATGVLDERCYGAKSVRKIIGVISYEAK